jgi:hypothetical protein
MRMSHIIFFIVFSLVAAPAGMAGPSDSKQPNKQAKGDRKPLSILTGCMDEQDGHYVLLDEKSMNPVADLDADGVPSEDLFAKHVGQKVTIRGSSTAGGSRPLFKVRSIETVSEVCATQKPQ